jgi:hypothetical protein
MFSLKNRIKVFIPFPSEWWHFDYKAWERYPISDVPFNQLEKAGNEEKQ